MKTIIVLLMVSIMPVTAKLPVMSDKTEWLGYFVGWVDREADFGIGADGESSLCPKKDREQYNTKEIKVRYLVEEKMNERWVRRQLLDEGGVVSEQEKGLDPEGPVVIVTTVTGDTKVEWTHLVDRGRVSIQPKLLSRTSENEIRVGVEFVLPKLYYFDGPLDERELKDKVGKDYVKATRSKDRKSVRLKFHEIDESIISDDYLADGASEIEVQSGGFLDKALMIESGDEKTGRIDVQPKGPLHNSFRMTWIADPEKLGQKDCHVTFWVE